jgi:hypothetical protein
VGTLRRLLVLVGLAGAVWALLRRRPRRRDGIVVGYQDGSEVRLDSGSELERLSETARRAL